MSNLQTGRQGKQANEKRALVDRRRWSNGYSSVMSFTTFLVIVIAVNLISGAVCGLIANRAGRDPFVWQLLGAILGPVAFVVLAGQLSRKRK
jgi:hypothetical protein